MLLLLHTLQAKQHHFLTKLANCHLFQLAGVSLSFCAGGQWQGFFSQAFLVFLMKESKKRRRKQPGKLMTKSCLQPVNLPSAQPLMNPLSQMPKSQVKGRCLQSPGGVGGGGAATAVTFQGTTTPNWPAQPTTKPQAPVRHLSHSSQIHLQLSRKKKNC